MNQLIIKTMKIRSITDVITNSSSETFIISYPKIFPEDLQKLLQGWRKAYLEEDNYSGEAGKMEVRALEDWSKKDCIYQPRKDSYISRIPWIPESLVVTIDFALTSTIRKFKEEFPKAYNIDDEVLYPVYDKEGKNILRLTSDYQEWKSLGDPLQMHGEWAVENMDWWNYEDKG